MEATPLLWKTLQERFSCSECLSTNLSRTEKMDRKKWHYR
jgi:hypothetical protein